jgi:hypothetical protein
LGCSNAGYRGCANLSTQESFIRVSSFVLAARLRPRLSSFPSLRKRRGTARQSAQPFLMCVHRLPVHGASRRAVAAISVLGSRVSWDEAKLPVPSPAGSRQRVVMPPNGFPEASRVRACEARARAPARTPRMVQPVRVPSQGSGENEYKPSAGGGG